MIKKGSPGEFGEDFQQGLDRIAARLKRSMRDMREEILRVFSSYHESNNQRFIALETTRAVTLATLDARVALVEERLLKVEKKISLPPA